MKRKGRLVAKLELSEPERGQNGPPISANRRVTGGILDIAMGEVRPQGPGIDAIIGQPETAGRRCGSHQFRPRPH
jgi:hypothetical protein